MDSFFYIVPLIAFFVLGVLYYFVYLLVQSQPLSKQPFPPVAQTCPDGWAYDATNDLCLAPTNIHTNFGSLLNTSSGLFTADAWPGPTFYSYRVDPTSTPLKLDMDFSIGGTKVSSVAITKGLYDSMIKRQAHNFRVGFSPSDSFFKKSGTKICEQKNWANLIGIAWDGVSNYNQC